MTPKRRVLHVLATAERAGTAIFRIVESVAVAARSTNYEIEVCFLQPGELAERLTQLGVRWSCVHWSGGMKDPAGAARYAALLRSSDFSIIHQHTGGNVLTGLGRRFTPARIVQSLHGRVSEEDGRVVPRRRIPRTDALIANSRVMAEYSRDPRAVVIYPGVDAESFIVPKREHGGVVIGTACRLELVKGISHLIRAVAMLQPEFPDLQLEIAGDGSLRGALEEECRGLVIAGATAFLGWREDLVSVMAGWDIFAMPSLDEGFGFAALEAMAAGLPVVASAVGGLPELVQEGETGWLVPPASAGELAGQLKDLIEDSDRRRAMGEAGRRRARNEFGASRMVRQTFEVYERLIGDLRRRAN